MNHVRTPGSIRTSNSQPSVGSVVSPIPKAANAHLALRFQRSSLRHSLAAYFNFSIDCWRLCRSASIRPTVSRSSISSIREIKQSVSTRPKGANTNANDNFSRGSLVVIKRLAKSGRVKSARLVSISFSMYTGIAGPSIVRIESRARVIFSWWLRRLCCPNRYPMTPLRIRRHRPALPQFLPYATAAVRFMNRSGTVQRFLSVNRRI